MNTSLSHAFSRHWSADAEVIYRPFTFRQGTQEQFQIKTRSVSLGGRYWLWHCYSGMYIDTSVTIQEYNEGGISSPLTNEGNRYGIGLGGGYAHMISPHFNLDFGWGLWGGKSTFTTYSCPRCGDVLKAGEKTFLLPDMVTLAISYIF